MRGLRGVGLVSGVLVACGCGVADGGMLVVGEVVAEASLFANASGPAGNIQQLGGFVEDGLPLSGFDSISESRPDISVATSASASGSSDGVSLSLAGSVDTSASVDFSLQGQIGVGAEMTSGLILFSAFELTSSASVRLDGFLEVFENGGLPTSVAGVDLTLINQDTGVSVFASSSAGAFDEEFELEAGVYELNVELTGFTVVNFAVLDGEFNAGAEVNVTVLPGAPCPTDLDGDGVTDLSDLLALLSAFGSSADGDTDGDGDTDLDDLLAVLSAFGTSCP